MKAMLVIVVASAVTTALVALLIHSLERWLRERRERERAQRLMSHNILFIDRPHKGRLIKTYGIRTPEGRRRR